jgi:hypothetical protein
MASEADFMAALQRADAVGDTAGAQAIANHIKALRGVASGVQGAPSAPVQGAGPGAAPAVTEGVLNPDGSSPLLDRMKYGLAGVGIQGYLGAKNLVTKLTPEEQNVLAQSRADVENSGFAGKAANLAGNVGLGVASSILTPALALPAAVAAKVAPAVIGAGKAALGSGAMEFVTHPAEDQENVYGEKLQAAKNAALAGAGTYAGGKILAKAGTGLFQATKDAADLFRQGINPTLQQGAEGRVGRFVGGLTSGFTNTRARQEAEALDALTSNASGGKVSMPGATLNQRVDALQTGVDADQAALMQGKRFPLTKATRDAMLSEADNIKGSQGQLVNEQGKARNILDNILGDLPGARPRMSYDAVQSNYLDHIDRAMDNSRNVGPVADALGRARDVLTNSVESKLKPDELAQLRDIQARQTDVDAMSALTAGRGGEGEGLKIGKLADVYGNLPDAATNATNESLVGPLVRTMGATPRQDESRTIKHIAVQMAKGAGLGTLAHFTGTSVPMAGLYGLSAIGQTAPGAKALLGQYGPQLAAKAALESPTTGEVTMANLLRTLRDRLSAIGAAEVGP